MIIIKASTKRGQNIISRCNHKQGEFLDDVYKNYSSSKAKAYRDCRQWFSETDNHTNFRITGTNCMSFSIAWNGTKDGEPILRYETKDNSYMVLLNQ